MSLDVNEVCFDEERDIPNTREKSTKGPIITGWCKCRTCGAMDTDVKCLSDGEVKQIWNNLCINSL